MTWRLATLGVLAGWLVLAGCVPGRTPMAPTATVPPATAADAAKPTAAAQPTPTVAAPGPTAAPAATESAKPTAAPAAAGGSPIAAATKPGDAAKPMAAAATKPADAAKSNEAAKPTAASTTAIAPGTPAAAAKPADAAKPGDAAKPADAAKTDAAGKPGTAPSGDRTFDARRISMSIERVGGPFVQPLYVTHAGDGSGRLYVLEKVGRIRRMDGSMFLDISGRVLSPALFSYEREQGMLGLAFHPRFRENGYLYVHYNDRTGKGSS